MPFAASFSMRLFWTFSKIKVWTDRSFQDFFSFSYPRLTQWFQFSLMFRLFFVFSMLKQKFFRITGNSIANFLRWAQGHILISILLEMIRASSSKEMKIKINYTHKWIANDFPSQKMRKAFYTCLHFDQTSTEHKRRSNK